MPDYKWKVSFILNGAKCEKTVNIGDWLIENLEPKNRKNRVIFTRRFTSPQYREYWDVYDSALKEVNALLDVMSIGVFFNFDFIYFPSMSDFEVAIENEAELRRLRQPVPTKVVIINFTNSLNISNKGANAVMANLSKIASNPNREIINHCLSLYRRALSYEDKFDKFFDVASF